MRPEADAVVEFNRQAELDGWFVRADTQLEFEAAELVEALDVWRTARDGCAIPIRTALTPQAMKRFLSKVAIVDIVRGAPEVRLRVRVTGTALDQTYGIKHGSFFDEVLAEPSLTRWQRTFDLPLRSKSPVRTSGRVGFHDMTFLSAETLLAPMGADIDQPDSILVVVHLSQFQAQTTDPKNARSHAA